jgi:hypothetical protein
MELTKSWERVFDEELRRRYEFAEVRNAAATLKATNPAAFDHIVTALSGFALSFDDLVVPGGNKGAVATRLDRTFRELGWREAGHESKTVVTFTLRPFHGAGETQPEIRSAESLSRGHKVDNVLGGAALDVEWNAKDGNLDRDLSNFSALHEYALVDVGVILTRHQQRTKYAANTLAELANRVVYKDGKRVVLLSTTTTTNFEQLVWRMQRGDGRGCPVLAIAVTELSYQPGAGEPQLPPYRGPIEIPGGVPEDPEEEPEA